jgi:peptide chain release factor subunit 1
VLKNKETEALSTQYVDPEKVVDQSLYKDKRTGVELEMVSDEPLNEWLVEHYKDYGTQLQLVTDKSSEGFQFVKGFQGIGGFLRFKLEQEHFANNNMQYDDEDDFI